MRGEIKDIVNMFDNGYMLDMYNRDTSSDSINGGMFGVMGMNTKVIESELRSINKGINGIVIPENNFDYDLMRNIFTHYSKRGNKVKKTESKLF